MYNTNGLKEDEVKESRKKYGSNSIKAGGCLNIKED